MTHVQPDKEDMVTQSDRQVLVWCADPGDWTYEQLCACILPNKENYYAELNLYYKKWEPFKNQAGQEPRF